MCISREHTLSETDASSACNYGCNICKQAQSPICSVLIWINIYGYTLGFMYLHYTHVCGVFKRHKVLQPIHPYHLLQCVLLCLDTDHTGRARFPSSWQQGYQATNQNPLSPVLQADWFLSLQLVVECPSLTSLLPCTLHISYISIQITATCVILRDVVSRFYTDVISCFSVLELEHLN